MVRDFADNGVAMRPRSEDAMATIPKVYVGKVAPTQAKNWGSPFWAGDSDVICQLALGKNF